MNTLGIETTCGLARATRLVMGKEAFTVCLADGREIKVPYRCYPRVHDASAKQRSHFEVYADGKMIHWPDIDEDIAVQHIVEGRMPVKAHTVVAESRVNYHTPSSKKGRSTR